MWLLILLLLSTTPAWAESGLSEKPARHSNLFDPAKPSSPGIPLNPAQNDPAPDTSSTPSLRYDPSNPTNPASRYIPNNPFNPANDSKPQNLLNPPNRYNPNAPFPPLNPSR
jgi:hypothetical protein